MHFFKRHAKTEGLTNRHLIVTIVTIASMATVAKISNKIVEYVASNKWIEEPKKIIHLSAH
jgi:hypothetical protein